MRTDKVRYLAIMLLVWLPVGAAAEPPYLCVTESVIGFAYDKEAQEWQPKRIQVNDKYMVSDSNEYEMWVVTRIGGGVPLSFCAEGWSKQGFLICDGSRNFRMSRLTLRFIWADLMGYWIEIPSELDKNETTPYIAIGSCSPIDHDTIE